MKHFDLAWVAGLLEGEGSFGRKSRKVGTARNIQVTWHMTDLDVLQRLKKLVGEGNLLGPYSNPGRTGSPTNKPRYAFSLSGPKAYKLMKQILPFMLSRRSAKNPYAPSRI